jgi:hypothetical protein
METAATTHYSNTPNYQKRKGLTETTGSLTHDMYPAMTAIGANTSARTVMQEDEDELSVSVPDQRRDGRRVLRHLRPPQSSKKTYQTKDTTSVASPTQVGRPDDSRGGKAKKTCSDVHRDLDWERRVFMSKRRMATPEDNGHSHFQQQATPPHSGDSPPRSSHVRWPRLPPTKTTNAKPSPMSVQTSKIEHEGSSSATEADDWASSNNHSSHGVPNPERVVERFRALLNDKDVRFHFTALHCSVLITDLNI